MVEKPPANAGDVGPSLGGEDPLEKEMTTNSNILPWKSHGQRSLVGTVHGVAELDMTERLFNILFIYLFLFMNLGCLESHIDSETLLYWIP